MQPCVEAAQLQLNSMVLAGSPAGIGGGDNTGNIPGGLVLILFPAINRSSVIQTKSLSDGEAFCLGRGWYARA